MAVEGVRDAPGRGWIASVHPGIPEGPRVIGMPQRADSFIHAPTQVGGATVRGSTCTPGTATSKKNRVTDQAVVTMESTVGIRLRVKVKWEIA